jgi:hypothetical protein
MTDRSALPEKHGLGIAVTWCCQRIGHPRRTRHERAMSPAPGIWRGAAVEFLEID